MQNVAIENFRMNQRKALLKDSHGSFFNYSWSAFSNGTSGSREVIRGQTFFPLTWEHTIHDDEF